MADQNTQRPLISLESADLKFATDLRPGEIAGAASWPQGDICLRKAFFVKLDEYPSVDDAKAAIMVKLSDWKTERDARHG